MTLTTKQTLGAAFLAFVLVLALTTDGHAAVPSTGILDDVLTQYQSRVSQWQTQIKRHADYLYWSLVLISMVWTFGQMALQRAELSEFFAEFTRFTASTGFFWWLLDNGPAFGSSIIDSMRMIGGDAAGTGRDLSPSSLLDIGFTVLGYIIDQSSVWSPVDSGVSLLLGFALLGMCAFVAIQVTLLILSGWVLAYGGIFFLGFGGGRWTSDMAINYYKALLQLGAQLLAVTLLIGIGKDIVTAQAAALGSNITLRGLAVLGVSIFVFVALVTTLPYMLSSLVTGGSVQQPGQGSGMMGAIGAMGAVAGAAALSGGMIGGALGGAKDALASGTGAASALRAAFGGAVEASKAGTDMFSGGSWGSGGNRATAAAGHATQMAAQTASNLWQTGGSMARDAVGKAVESAASGFQEQVADTVGGKLAEAIKGPDLGDGGADGGAALRSATAALDPNSGGSGAGWQEAFVSDEVSAFVNGGVGAAGGTVEGGGGSSFPGSSGGGGRGSEGPWTAATGGVAGLSERQLESAKESFATWREQGGRHGFADYVQYVQDREAERRGK